MTTYGALWVSRMAAFWVRGIDIGVAISVMCVDVDNMHEALKLGIYLFLNFVSVGHVVIFRTGRI